MEENVTGNSINIMVIGMSNEKLNNLFFRIVALPSVPSHVGHIVLPSRQRPILIHLVVCLTTGPKPLPKRALHIVRSRASSFK